MPENSARGSAVSFTKVSTRRASVPVSFGRDGERDIANDAQALRRAALKLIAELERSPAIRAMATAARENA
jgi:hypothetical protein